MLARGIRYVPNFAEIADPLNKLAAPKSPWIWTEKCTESFETLKKCLISPPILVNPTADGKFVLEAEASDHSLGAVLKQEQDGDLKVIAYASRTLNPGERKFTVTEKECLAVVWGVHEKFRHYLELTKFVVRTDHMALKWLP